VIRCRSLLVSPFNSVFSAVIWSNLSCNVRIFYGELGENHNTEVYMYIYTCI
jgi:hypothetical protein